jgi:hypothetical protein
MVSCLSLGSGSNSKHHSLLHRSDRESQLRKERPSL